MSEGWIKLHRKTLECPVAMIDAEHLAIWVYLLLHATHKEVPMMFGGEKIMLHPGQLITGHTKIAADLKISRSKVQRVLNCFKNDMQIDTQTCTKGTLITILSWDKYQIDDTQSDMKTIRNRYASDTQVGTNKNEKNENNEINILPKGNIKRFTPPTVEEVKSYCQERGNRIDAEHFVDYYTSNGWMVGRNKMKDWKAAVRQWEKNSFGNGGNNGRAKNESGIDYSSNIIRFD